MSVMKTLFELARQDKDLERFSNYREWNENDKQELLERLRYHRLLFLIPKSETGFLSHILPEEQLRKELLLERVRFQLLMQKEKSFFDEVYSALKEIANNPVVLVKGATTRKIYDEKYSRSSGDIDLLVSPDDCHRINDLLLEFGFKRYTYNESEINNNTLDRMLELTTHLFAYSHVKYGSVEIHQYSNSNLDVYKMYSQCLNDNGVYVLNDIDSFIYICYHAWHHYPKGGGFEKETSLRHFVDIREYYLYLKRNDLSDRIYDRAIEVDYLSIVQNMIYAAERMLGNFCDDIKLKIPVFRYDHDWNCRYYSSPIEHRVFDFSKELARISDLYLKSKKRPKANAVFGALPLLLYSMDSYETSPQSFFHNSCYYSERIPPHKASVKWGVSYDEENLFFGAEISCNKITLNSCDEFFMGADCITFVLQSDTVKRKVEVSFQPHSDGTVRLYGEDTGIYYEKHPLCYGKGNVISTSSDNINFIAELPLKNWDIRMDELKSNCWRCDVMFSHVTFGQVFEAVQMSWGLGVLKGYKTAEELIEFYPEISFE